MAASQKFKPKSEHHVHQSIHLNPLPTPGLWWAELHKEPQATNCIMCVCSTVKLSAAEECGLLPGDLIIEFAGLTKENFTGLGAIAAIIRDNPGKQIPITVLRASQAPGNSRLTFTPIHLVATPYRWSGGGVLGCVLNSWPVSRGRPETATLPLHKSISMP